MKIILKYILKEFIKPFFACSLIFLLLFNFAEGFRVVGMEDKANDALQHLFSYLFYQSPLWLIQIMPMSLLLGFLFSYSNLAHHNEITAIKAGGVNLNRIFMPIILLSLLVSSFVLVANEKIITYTNKKSEIIYKQKVKGHKIHQQKLFSDINYLGKNHTKFLIKSFNAKNNRMYNINIDTFANISLKKQIYAKYATWKYDTSWEFENGIIRTFDSETQTVLKEEFFIKRIIDINEGPNTFKVDNIKHEQMTIAQLRKSIVKLKRNSIPAYRELTELYHKTAFPFANTIVILIGIAFASASLKNNKVISFAVGLAVSFMYWGVSSIFISLGSNGVLPPLLAAWSTNIIFIILSIFFIIRIKK
ncbi:MAG: YjgP/YjgQ family permease [bacterium]|nr:YjgP/YjgQ family permease [bacterium]